MKGVTEIFKRKVNSQMQDHNYINEQSYGSESTNSKSKHFMYSSNNVPSEQVQEQTTNEHYQSLSQARGHNN